MIRPRRALGVTLLLGIAASSALGGACKAPTQITIELHTDVRCADVRGTAITVGSLGGLEGTPATTVTTACDPATGRIGSMVIVPSGARDDQVALRFVMGLGRDPSECTPPSYGAGCVVARRALRFIEGRSLVVPVFLGAVCNGIPCEATQTCAGGSCSTAVIEDSSRCTEPGGCGESALGPGTTPDAGPPDAPPADAAVPPPDAGVDAATGRVSAGLLAEYAFDEGGGTVARDRSGVAPTLDLQVPTNVAWTPGGVRFTQPSRIGSSGPAKKIYEACRATNEVTFEAWITYGTLPGFCRVVALAADQGAGNAALTSDPTIVGFDLRTSVAAYQRDTFTAFPAAPSGRKHLVATRTAAGEKRIYVDGALSHTASQAGDFSTWEPTYVLSIGNTPANDRPFYGEIHLAAVYARALTPAEVTQNFVAGP